MTSSKTEKSQLFALRPKFVVLETHKVKPLCTTWPVFGQAQKGSKKCVSTCPTMAGPLRGLSKAPKDISGLVSSEISSYAQYVANPNLTLNATMCNALSSIWLCIYLRQHTT